MKQFILGLGFLLLTAQAKAFFYPQVGYSIYPNVVTAQVYNSSAYTIFCQGWVYGYTQAGTYQNAWFSNYIYPFNSAYAYVYAYYPYYFVNAWSDIRCR